MLLKDILRGEWQLPGIHRLGLRRDRRHVPAPQGRRRQPLRPPPSASRSGTDLDCGRVYPSLVQSVRQGLISEAEIDTSLYRLFLGRMKLGMFDPPELGEVGADSIQRPRSAIASGAGASSRRANPWCCSRTRAQRCRCARRCAPSPSSGRMRTSLAHAARQLQRRAIGSGDALAWHPRSPAERARDPRDRVGPRRRVPGRRACAGERAFGSRRAARSSSRVLRRYRNGRYADRVIGRLGARPRAGDQELRAAACRWTTSRSAGPGRSPRARREPTASALIGTMKFRLFLDDSLVVRSQYQATDEYP